jgi:glucosylceramidase
MKESSDNTLAPFCDGQCGGKLDPSHYQDFADYLVNYVKQMHSAGVDIFAVSFANEPLFANPFESCVYTEKSYAAVLRVVGESFRQSGLATKLFGPEHMGSVSVR